jgi:hypothetical protein
MESKIGVRGDLGSALRMNPGGHQVTTGRCHFERNHVTLYENAGGTRGKKPSLRGIEYMEC